MFKITRFYLLVLLLAVASQGKAQVPSLNPVNGVVPAILNAAGGSYDNPASYNRYEWSFGEMLLIDAFKTPDSSLLVTQGVLQPCTDKVGLSAFTVLFDKGDYKLFPNPNTGKFEIDFFVTTPGQMTLEVVNALGQILSTKSFHYDGCCRVELFDLTRHPDGVYHIAATLRPDMNRPGDDIMVIRHSGLKVIKLSQK